MADLRSQLDPETQRRADQELTSQIDRSFEQLIETERKLTQHNFLVNAGGAAAALAYMRSSQGTGFAIWPLACFLVGVVASGIEVRFLAKFFKALHDDAVRRRSQFTQDKVSLSDAVPIPDVGKYPSRVHHWSGLVAQWAFPVGVVLGIFSYFR
jgi:hypothetical protein